MRYCKNGIFIVTTIFLLPYFHVTCVCNLVVTSEDLWIRSAHMQLRHDIIHCCGQRCEYLVFGNTHIAQTSIIYHLTSTGTRGWGSRIIFTIPTYFKKVWIVKIHSWLDDKRMQERWIMNNGNHPVFFHLHLHCTILISPVPILF